MAITDDQFRRLYAERAESVLRFFVRRTLDPQAAADLTAETFASALSSRAGFDSGRGSQEAWLFGIARHQLGRYARHLRVETAARRRAGFPDHELSPDDLDQIEQLIDFRQLREGLRNALAELTADQRTAVWYRVVDELSYQEIARRMQSTDALARARVSRGLKHLAQTYTRIDQEGTA